MSEWIKFGSTQIRHTAFSVEELQRFQEMIQDEIHERELALSALSDVITNRTHSPDLVFVPYDSEGGYIDVA